MQPQPVGLLSFRLAAMKDTTVRGFRHCFDLSSDKGD